MRQAPSELANQPILECNCYKLGCLILYTKCSLCYETSLYLIFMIQSGNQTIRERWKSCRACKCEPIDLYNAADLEMGNLYVP